MVYNIYFDISAVMITGVVLIAGKVSGWIPTNKNRFYRYLVLAVFLSALTDLISCLMEMYPMDYFWWGGMRHVFTSLYILFHTACGMCCLLFVLSLANVNAYRQKNRILITGPMFLSAAMLGINLFVPVYFSYDRFGVYRRGVMMPLQMLIGLYYLVQILYVSFRYRKLIGEKNRRLILIFVFTAFGGILIQYLNPGFVIGDFISALMVIMIYCLVENADEIKDERYGIITRNAFLRMADLNISSKVGFKLIFLHLSDSHETTGKDQIHSELIAQIVGYLLKTFGQEAWICRWSDDILVLDLNGGADERAQEIMENLELRFRDPWVSGDYAQTIGACMWLIRCPEDVQSLSELTAKIDMIHSIGISRYRGILNIAEMDFSRISYQLTMERNVQASLKNHTAKVLYEPVFSVAENRYVSARSVIYFPDPEGKMVSGSKFLNTSDTSVLLSRLDEYAFEDAAKHMKLFLDEAGLVSVSTRLSFSEVIKPGFDGGLRRRCERYNADYRKFLLRISGGTQINLPKEGRDLVRRMSEEGWRFAMDDFGYGLSILDRMAASEIPFLIMHPEVTRAALSGDEGVMMGCGLVYTVHGLKKKMAMAGIMTKEDAELAKNIGADYLCGPYFCEPMPAEELAVWVKERNAYAVQ